MPANSPAFGKMGSRTTDPYRNRDDADPWPKPFGSSVDEGVIFCSKSRVMSVSMRERRPTGVSIFAKPQVTNIRCGGFKKFRTP